MCPGVGSGSPGDSSMPAMDSSIKTCKEVFPEVMVVWRGAQGSRRNHSHSIVRSWETSSLWRSWAQRSAFFHHQPPSGRSGPKSSHESVSQGPHRVELRPVNLVQALYSDLGLLQTLNPEGIFFFLSICLFFFFFFMCLCGV